MISKTTLANFSKLHATSVSYVAAVGVSEARHLLIVVQH